MVVRGSSPFKFMKRYPSKKELRKYFRYKKGCLYWIKECGRNHHIGKRAGSLSGKGYRQVGFKEIDFFEHRLIWIFHYGATTKFIDGKFACLNAI